MIEIDVGNIMFDDEGGALIVCAPTGVIYTAQAGGMSCLHPRAEGFFLPVWDICPAIDDCAMGCHMLNKRTSPEFDRPDLRKNLADSIDSEIKKLADRYSFDLRFDFERIDDLMEGWWPLRIKGALHGVCNLDHQCYLHCGNCD